MENNKIENYQEKRSKFEKEVDKILLKLFEKENHFENHFYDPVNLLINETLDIKDGDRSITQEMGELVTLFGYKLINFCQNIFLKENITTDELKVFYRNLYVTFFNRSPNIFELLGKNYLETFLLYSKINETYILNRIVDTSGELTYGFTFHGGFIESIQQITSLEVPDKISVIKQIGYTAYRTFYEGYSDPQVFEDILLMLNKIKETENNPIVLFVINFELGKLSSLENEDRSEVSKKDRKIFKNIHDESNHFFEHHKIKLNLEGVFYSQTSKDFGSILDQRNLIPIGLVKIDGEKSKQSQEAVLDKETVNKTESLLKKINSKDFKASTQDYIDFVDYFYLLKRKNYNFLSFLKNQDESLFERIFSKRVYIGHLSTLLDQLDEKSETDEVLEQEYEKIINELVFLIKEVPVEEIIELFKKNVADYYNSNNVLLIDSYENVISDRKIKQSELENISYIIKMLHIPEIREEINSFFNIKIEDFYLRDQTQFLKYLSEIDISLFTKIKNIINSFKNTIDGSNFIRSFLSGAIDKNFNKKILDLGEKLPTETASKIFSKYAEIIDSVENVLNAAQNNFRSTIDTKPELLQSIEQSLYRRGADLLAQFHDNINQNPNDILAELDRINADTITTLSIFKYAAKFGNKLPLEDISSAEFSKKTGNELTAEEINEMEHIYQANWKNYGNQELIRSVIQKFKNSLVGEHADREQVYTFKKNDQINAFVKFSELQQGVKYASALNVDQSSKGFGLGEAMMDEALYREAQENILIATCDPYNDSNMRYFEKGFIGTGFTGDNPPVMNICWNESMNNHIQSKHVSVDDLVMMYLKKQVPSNLSIKKGKTLQEIHTDIPAGKSLTRCFKDPLHTGDWYAVYEPIPMDYETNIKTTQ